MGVTNSDKFSRVPVQAWGPSQLLQVLGSPRFSRFQVLGPFLVVVWVGLVASLVGVLGTAPGVALGGGLGTPGNCSRSRGRDMNLGRSK